MTAEAKPASSALVSTQWLQDHLDAPDIVVVDGSYYLPAMKRNAREEYLSGHIPGAVYFDIDAISDHSSDLPHMLPSPEAFSSAMRSMGIGDGITIVVYDGIGLFSAPRVWWTFRTFGVRDVYILDGGLPKWKTEGRALDFGEVRRTPRHFTSRFNRGAVADVDDVKKALAHPDIQVVDARSAGRFAGTAPEPRPGLKSGHMPGALNLPYDTLLEDGR
jgi:thiosulfate/3-mercaptopyruvate sulfurtransferase